MSDQEPELTPDYSTWLDAVHGPLPRPGWVVTELGAVDTELGIIKTGKEADVFLLERAVSAERGCLLAVKRYRSSEHRLFHRDADYLSGRRVRRSRENRAMARRTDFGRDLIAQKWAAAEFAALSRLWSIGRTGGGESGEGGAIRVPYPVQLRGTELMLEFIGDDDGHAAPRLAELRPEPALLAELYHQLCTGLSALATAGLAHGDLSAYNLLVHQDQLVMIDLPQIVDLVGNPNGPQFLARDVQVITTWFRSRGLPDHLTDAEALFSGLLHDARLTS